MSLILGPWPDVHFDGEGECHRRSTRTVCGESRPGLLVLAGRNRGGEGSKLLSTATADARGKEKKVSQGFLHLLRANKKNPNQKIIITQTNKMNNITPPLAACSSPDSQLSMLESMKEEGLGRMMHVRLEPESQLPSIEHTFFSGSDIGIGNMYAKVRSARKQARELCMHKSILPFLGS